MNEQNFIFRLHVFGTHRLRIYNIKTQRHARENESICLHRQFIAVQNKIVCFFPAQLFRYLFELSQIRLLQSVRRSTRHNHRKS